jgi:6,7-dimethyl-8-ribityllumazine synthase
MSSDILIINAPFYKEISEMLQEGAEKYLKNVNLSFDSIKVSGALEIPAAISIINNSKNARYLGYVALGCVIRGETSHYDYVCSESARGLMDLTIKDKICIGNGILTVENNDQAIKRADINQLDKGGFAAKACVDLIKIKESYNK